MLSPVGEIARHNDPDEFLAALFWPAALREHVFTLIALRHELGSIRDKISEPLLGQIRLQWWRETLEKLEPKAGLPAHPVIQAIGALLCQKPAMKPVLRDLLTGYESDFAENPSFEHRAEVYWQAKLLLAEVAPNSHQALYDACWQAEALRLSLRAGGRAAESPAKVPDLIAALRQPRLVGSAKLAFLPRITLALWLKKLMPGELGVRHPALGQPSPWRALALVWEVYLR